MNMTPETLEKIIDNAYRSGVQDGITLGRIQKSNSPLKLTAKR